MVGGVRWTYADYVWQEEDCCVGLFGLGIRNVGLDFGEMAG